MVASWRAKCETEQIQKIDRYGTSGGYISEPWTASVEQNATKGDGKIDVAREPLCYCRRQTCITTVAAAVASTASGCEAIDDGDNVQAMQQM